MKRILLSALLLVTAVVLSSLFTASETSAAAIKSLSGCAANTLPANDDGSTGAVSLPFSPNFFGTTYSSLFVNNNGNVTFDSAQSSYTPFDLLSTSRVIIAPFFGDVDTRGAGSGVVTYGNTTFSGRAAFCVNWINVGYFSSNTDKLNSFQLLLIDRSDIGVGDFDIMMNYDHIQWETGDFSGGTDGLGGSSARVGYSNGINTALELPGSAVNGALLDSSASGLVNNSRGSLIGGRYLFPVRSGEAPAGGSISGTVFAGTNGGPPTPGSLEQYATSAIASSNWGATPGNSWNASQTTGAPDNLDATANPRCGDYGQSWAPQSSGSDPEWLEASFATPVYATGLTVWETYNAPFIYQVDLIDTGNVYHTIWTGTDTTPCPGQFTRTFAQTSYLVDGIKIYTQVAGWEEIDAVQLVGQTSAAGGPAGAVPLEGAPVHVCTPGVSPCDMTVTNTLGEYTFTGLAGEVNYFVTAFPPAGSFLGPRTIGALFLAEGGALTGQDVVLIPSVPAPANVTIDTPFRAGDGTPAINSAGSTPMTQTASCPGGFATWSLTQGGVVIDSGPMVETSPGTYTATIPPQGASRAGRADMKISIDCPAPTPDKQTVFDIYIDPAGTVRTVGGDPIAGATVTLFRSDSSTGPFDQVPDGDPIMSPSNRTNPDTTGADGVFRWDVIAGFYKVRAEKDGCVSPTDPAQTFVETEVMTIPPPVTDLDIRLDCGGVPPPATPTATATSPGLPTATPTRTPTSPGLPTATPTPTSPAACADDSFEDNDTRGTAAPVALPFSRSGLRVCPGDDDWFSILLFAGDAVQIDALFAHAEGDIDIDLISPSGANVGSSLSVSDDEKISYAATSSGTYAVRVELYSDDGTVEGNSYALQISAEAVTFGDVNCNSTVDSIDAALVLQFVAGLLGSLSCQDAADVNQNATVDSIDAALVLQFVAGLIPSLPV